MLSLLLNSGGLRAFVRARFLALGIASLGLGARLLSQTPAVLSGPILNPANGHQYYLLDFSTWEQAETRAGQLGGHLVTVNDAAENQWIYTQFGQGPGGGRSLWIGLFDPLRQPTPGLTSAVRAARFAWVSGEPVSYSNWWPGRPNNAGNTGDGTGTQFWGYLRPDLLWDDVDNSLNFTYGVVEVGLPKVTGDDRNQAIQLASLDRLTVSGSNVGATREPGEPRFHGTQPGGASIWYRWKSPGVGALSVRLEEGSPHQMAVYTPGLGRLGARSPSNSGAFFPITIAVTTGQEVLIAVEGVDGFFGTPEESYTLALALLHAPANDRFADRTPFPPAGTGPVEGSLLGASQEPGEPDPARPGTVWWRWTAPTGLGAGGAWTTVSVTGNQDVQPLVRVWEGARVDQLQATPGEPSVAGFTHHYGFRAQAGQEYQISVAGQPFDPSGAVGNDAFARYRLDLVSSALTLRSFQIGAVHDEVERTTRLSGIVRVQNLGDTPTRAVRLRLYRRDGFATKNSQITPNADPNFIELVDSIEVSVTGLAAGQSVEVPIVLDLPASEDPSQSFEPQARGWGGFAVLEEEVPTPEPPALWRPVDRRLLGTGIWPSFTEGVLGPGGGVIRLDPNGAPLPAGALVALEVSGPATVNAGAGALLLARARWADGVESRILPEWSVEPPATISALGQLSTTGLTTSRSLPIQARFQSGGITLIETRVVTVVGSQPVLGAVVRTANGLTVPVTGKPGTRLRVERSVDLRFWNGATEVVLPAGGQLELPVRVGDGLPEEFVRLRVL